jgi:hypothetical protein
MGGGVMGCKGGPEWIRSLVPGMGEGGNTLPNPYAHPHFMPKPDQPSPWRQFLSQS